MRILIVEDDAALARGIVSALRLSGFAVDHAARGAEVLPWLRQEAYALVVLDLGLPDRSGFDVLREIRRAGLAVPVMILTARTPTSPSRSIRPSSRRGSGPSSGAGSASPIRSSPAPTWSTTARARSRPSRAGFSPCASARSRFSNR